MSSSPESWVLVVVERITVADPPGAGPATESRTPSASSHRGIITLLVTLRGEAHASGVSTRPAGSALKRGPSTTSRPFTTT